MSTDKKRTHLQIYVGTIISEESRWRKKKKLNLCVSGNDDSLLFDLQFDSTIEPYVGGVLDKNQMIKLRDLINAELGDNPVKKADQESSADIQNLYKLHGLNKERYEEVQKQFQWVRHQLDGMYQRIGKIENKSDPKPSRPTIARSISELVKVISDGGPVLLSHQLEMFGKRITEISAQNKASFYWEFKDGSKGRYSLPFRAEESGRAFLTWEVID